MTVSPARAGATDEGTSAAALSLIGITKRFGQTLALDDVTMHVRAGHVHALLGENGAGKTTLMRVAFGMLQPDNGSIQLAGHTRRIGSPGVALSSGMGMVHQHFTLVPAMTVAENVALGGHGLYSASRWAARVREIGERTGLTLDPEARVSQLPVGAQQRCEIVKALARDVRVLILDEPTAVLAPREAQELLRWIAEFAKAGHAVVLITHKLRDAMAVASDVTVLRLGKCVLHTGVADTTERALADAMLGAAAVSGGDRESRARNDRNIHPASDQHIHPASDQHSDSTSDRGEPDAIPVSTGCESANANLPTNAGVNANVHSKTNFITSAEPSTTPHTTTDTNTHRVPRTSVVLTARNVTVRDAGGVLRVDSVSLQVCAGEIVGIAAVEGAGQRELLRLLAGRLQPLAGELLLPDNIGFVPEDRHHDALMLDRSLLENVALRDAGVRRGRMPWTQLQEATEDIVAQQQVRTTGVLAEARTLSGGNQQKLILGRELRGAPAALVVENPTRGLDFRATQAVHEALRSASNNGTAVVVYSSDLDEVLALSDRVMVMHAGRLAMVAPVEGTPTHTATSTLRDAVGRAMLGT